MEKTIINGLSQQQIKHLPPSKSGDLQRYKITPNDIISRRILKVIIIM